MINELRCALFMQQDHLKFPRFPAENLYMFRAYAAYRGELHTPEYVRKFSSRYLRFLRVLRVQIGRVFQFVRIIKVLSVYYY